MIIVNARFLTQPITGVQRYALEISKLLREIYKQDELCFVSPNNIIHKEDASYLKVKVVGKFTGHIWEQIELPLFLNKNDLLINLCNTGPIFHTKKVVAIHDITFKAYPKSFSKNFLRLYNFLIPQLAKNSLQIITVSEFSKCELLKFYGNYINKIEVVYNAVGDDFKKTEAPSLVNKKYLLMVSSLNARKNLIRTLDAFHRISDDYLDLNLFVIGDIVSKSFKGLNLDKYLQNERIVFLGRISDADLVEYYSQAKGFLYPSIYEGFGIPPLEAQACECPIVVSNTSSLPEIFKDSAIYCDPLDVDNMSNAFRKLLEDNSDELIEKGNINSKRFSWNKSADKLSSIINDLKEL